MYLEHANLTVASIEKSMAFLSTAFPEFKQRGGGPLFGDEKLGRWVHFGNDDTYIAMSQVNHEVEPISNNYQTSGVKHLGFVVEDVYSIIERCQAAGYQPTDASAMGTHPHRERVYFVDGCGMEWEFVQYLSDDKTEQNDYDL